MKSSRMWIMLAFAMSCGGEDEASAPPAQWPARTGACEQLGEDCSSCSDNGICFLDDPSLCVPPSVDGRRCGTGTCTGDRPYCIASRCLPLSEAACTCTGSIGRTLPECADPSTAAGR
jgi:hypothetical protein